MQNWLLNAAECVCLCDIHDGDSVDCRSIYNYSVESVISSASSFAFLSLLFVFLYLHFYIQCWISFPSADQNLHKHVQLMRRDLVGVWPLKRTIISLPLYNL